MDFFYDKALVTASATLKRVMATLNCPDGQTRYIVFRYHTRGYFTSLRQHSLFTNRCEGSVTALWEGNRPQSV